MRTMTVRRRPRLLPLLQPRVRPGAAGDEVTRTRTTTTTTTVVRSYCLAVAAALVVVSQLHVASVQGQSLGKCPKKESMKEFDPKEFEGQWYEVEKTFYMMEMTASCTAFNFTLRPDGTSYKVHIGTKNRITGNPNVFSGGATLITKNKSVLNYQADSRLPGLFARMLPTTGLYHIMYTDYDNYAILWSCTSFGLFHSDIIWILGRERDLTADVRAELYSILYDLSLNPDRLILTKHEKCEEFF